MPVEIRMFPELDLRWVRYWGNVEIADLQGTNRRVYSDPVMPLGRFGFLDFAEVTGIEITYSHLLATTQAADRIMRATGATLRSSCHAPSDLAYGMARTYHTLVENLGWAETFLSRDRAEAKEWLGLGPLPFD